MGGCWCEGRVCVGRGRFEGRGLVGFRRCEGRGFSADDVKKGVKKGVHGWVV